MEASMARSFRVNGLPPGILVQLRQRLIASQFSQYAQHAAWLQEQGFSVSKSAIHRFAVANAANLQTVDEGRGKMDVETRLRCLDIASRQTANEAETLARADAFLRWVRGA